MDNFAELTEIQRFYRGSTIFLTGATGFIGKLILEKILRCLPVKKVFILVRTKKNQKPDQRCEEIFASPAFNLLKRTDPDALKKVSIMTGDCALPDLGFSAQTRKIFVDEVDTIIHCAATTRFDHAIRQATFINVRSTRDIIRMAKDIKKLRTFIYMGTGYSNCNQSEIQEKTYEPKIAADRLITICENLDDNILELATPQLIEGWPNTYTFTKQITEDLINRECQSMPVCIMRPTIVLSTASEPMTAFVDNVFSLAGFVLSNAVGINRITYYKNVITDIIPADYVVSESIAAGWYVGHQFKATSRLDVPVFNISSGSENPITQDELYDFVDYYCKQVPSPNIPAYPCYFRTTCKYNYLFVRFFLHTLLAYVVDMGAKISGKTPIMVENIKKLHKFQESYEYFTTHEFFYHTENTHKMLRRMTFKDKEMFQFDVTTINWLNYFSRYSKGLRVYILNDPLETVPQGKKTFKKHEIELYFSVALAVVIFYVLAKVALFKVLPAIFVLLRYCLRPVLC
ncbi:fatty acyl-CoA reductase wat-like [Cylas formicarius]|uniref:fatty acyl-CoA reductase wat-like n=1 Tax=Cylas formicarius TaxID=197179 RepID=UPI002958DF12|nr:fatty acyl-CoA reductase wat-like [Cylas formicarius]